jgi:hypothetical protein
MMATTHRVYAVVVDGRDVGSERTTASDEAAAEQQAKEQAVSRYGLKSHQQVEVYKR